MNTIVSPAHSVHHYWITGFIVLVFLVGIGSPATFALIMVSKGNAPTQDHGWPTGSVDVANFERRLGFWEGPPFGGGEYHFEYRGGTEAFQQAIDQFAKIDAPRLLVTLHEGPIESTFLEDAINPKAKARFDLGPRQLQAAVPRPEKRFSRRAPEFSRASSAAATRRIPRRRATG
jgi:hypothetical protein